MKASDISIFTPRSQLQRSGIEHFIVFPPPAVISDNPTIKDLLSIIVSNHAETSTILRNIGTRLPGNGSLQGLQERGWHKGAAEGKPGPREDCVYTNLPTSWGAKRCACCWGSTRSDRTAPPRLPGRTPVWSCLAWLPSISWLDWTPSRGNLRLEHCQRLGPIASGKHRVIIANIFSRPLRNLLIKDARPINNDTTTPIYIAEDMTKKDHELKLLARAHVPLAYANGHKVSFRKGKLFINAKEVPIEST